MEKINWDQIKQFLRKPIFILTAVLIVGLITNVILFVFFNLPNMNESQKNSSTITQRERQIKALANLPIPQTISDTDVEKLLLHIPTNDEMARFIVDLKNIEGTTGVTITSFTFGDVKATDEVQAIVNEAVPTPAAVTPTPNPNGSKENLSQELKADLKIKGDYAHAVQFMNALYQSERLINIIDWDISTESNSKETNVNPLDQKSEITLDPIDPEQAPLTMELKISIYTAKTFAGKFKELTPIPADKENERSNPTMTDEKFSEIIQELNNSIHKAQ